MRASYDSIDNKQNSKGGEQRISPEPGHIPLPKIFDANVCRMDPSNELYKCSHWAEGAKLIFRPFLWAWQIAWENF